MKKYSKYERIYFVFPHLLLIFGTVGYAYTQTAHLQIAQANTRPKFAKELFFADARGDSANIKQLV